VGRGTFGIVYVPPKKRKMERARNYRRSRSSRGETEKNYIRRLIAEFSVPSALLYPNVVCTLDFLKGDYCEVMEFCTGGDLLRWAN
jgi:protein-serine/threonine kinase